MIINLINYTSKSLTVSTNNLSIDNIDYIAKRITISQKKETNNFLIYQAKLDISDSPKLSVLIQS